VYSTVGKRRLFCSARRSLRAEEVACKDGGASAGTGVLVPLWDGSVEELILRKYSYTYLEAPEEIMSPGSEALRCASSCNVRLICGFVGLRALRN